MKPGSQCDLILSYMREKGSITQKDAVELFDCYRLGARIHDLREMGYLIDSVPEKNKNGARWARYILRGEPDA